MLIAFVALIALVNYGLQWVGDITGWNKELIATYGNPLNFQLVIGWVLQYLAVGIGVPWHDALNFGSLIGTKVVLNEFVAYLEMGKMIAAKTLVIRKINFNGNLCFMRFCKS